MTRGVHQPRESNRAVWSGFFSDRPSISNYGWKERTAVEEVSIRTWERTRPRLGEWESGQKIGRLASVVNKCSL